jgi:hypothetical protein
VLSNSPRNRSNFFSRRSPPKSRCSYRTKLRSGIIPPFGASERYPASLVISRWQPESKPDFTIRLFQAIADSRPIKAIFFRLFFSLQCRASIRVACESQLRLPKSRAQRSTCNARRPSHMKIWQRVESNCRLAMRDGWESVQVPGLGGPCPGASGLPIWQSIPLAGAPTSFMPSATPLYVQIFQPAGGANTTAHRAPCQRFIASTGRELLC